LLRAENCWYYKFFLYLMKEDEVFKKAYCTQPKRSLVLIMQSFEELRDRMIAEQEGAMTVQRKRYIEHLEHKIELLSKAHNDGR